MSEKSDITRMSVDPGARTLIVALSVCCSEDEDGGKGQKEVEKSTDIGHVSGQSNAEKTSLFFP